MTRLWTGLESEVQKLSISEKEQHKKLIQKTEIFQTLHKNRKQTTSDQGEAKNTNMTNMMTFTRHGKPQNNGAK